jgi:para-aminobenzoate synthetase component I
MMRSWPVPAAETAPVALRAGRRVIIAAEPAEVVVASGADALNALDRLTPGWWAGYLSYDLGRVVEPFAPRRPDDLDLPDVLLARYDARAVLGPRGPRFEGRRSARAGLRHLLASAPPAGSVAPVGPGRSSLTRDAYEAGVETILELIRAGDCYQVNLTRRLTWPGAANPVTLGAALRAASPAPHESLLVLPRPNGTPVSVVSASPERYLAWRGARVETRPMKGTGARGSSLAASAKDRAENVMIVDLARNDLGRCCEFGSVRVAELCAVEQHPGLWHLVSTVRARRRPGIGPRELIRATFPPASVTGAPKPRVLQIIEELEPCRRGVYCGAIGWIDTERDEGEMAVGIRTFTLTDDQTHLGTGAGIVADSDPRREWLETELKVSRLTSILPGHEPSALLDPSGR